MNNNKQGEPPEWLVNLLIKARVFNRRLGRSYDRRKLALWMPLPVAFCALLVFIGLRGGTGKADGSVAGVVRGINMMLPPAQVNPAKGQDKMAAYAKAARDSAQLAEKAKEDPYAGGRAAAPGGTGTSGVAAASGGMRSGADSGKVATGIDQRGVSAEATADKALRQVGQLEQLLHDPAVGGSTIRGSTIRGMAVGGTTPRQVAGFPRVDAGQGTEGLRRDPEMERIDKMLDKLIRIQHPELLERDTSRVVDTRAVGPVGLLEAAHANDAIGSLDGSAGVAGFIEISQADMPAMAGHALGAMIDGEQTLTAGTTVALRLAEPGVINGLGVPDGQPLYGQASLSGERLKIILSSVRVGTTIVPVNIEVYDLDGLAGIRVPGAITRDVSKESAAEAMSGLGLASMDPSLTGQAATAGLQFAKSLASRKARLVRVTLPAGYRVLLMNAKH